MKRVAVDTDRPERETVLRASGVVLGGGVVLYPSDTVYGLLCRADDRAAVSVVGSMKGYEDDRPYILLVSGTGMASGVAVLDGPGVAGVLAESWPGPVSVVLPASPSCPEWVTAPDGTVALRQPADPLSRLILEEVRLPLVSTSANMAGRAAVLDPDRVPGEIALSVDLFLDGGVLPDRGPSRIVRPGGGGTEILRGGSGESS